MRRQRLRVSLDLADLREILCLRDPNPDLDLVQEIEFEIEEIEERLK